MTLLAASVIPGQEDAAKSDVEEARVLSLENAWNQAIQQRDARALQFLLAPELVFIDYNGTLMDKAQYMADVQAPSGRPTHVTNEMMVAHVYGSVAVVNGIYRETGVQKNGKPYTVRMRFIDTWIRRGPSWVCLASQSTLLH